MIISEKKCLLVASFGTTYTAEEKACIAATEKQMAENFSGYEIRRAFTSEMVRKILREQNGIRVDNVREALEKLRDDAFREVIIQPLHIIPGEEYHEKVRKVVAEFRHDFERIAVGNPLLMTVNDYAETIEALKTQLPTYCSNQAVILMGHGSAHPANAGYACLQLMLTDVLPQVYVGTVESYPALKHILPKLKAARCNKVVLMPFMLVAGDHAHHDLAGDGDDSWKAILEKSGYKVDVYFHGLGENPAFQGIYLRHAKDCMAVAGVE
ncbi:MAG: sirohydrochlorin cobaltochelatase [Desulfitobacteriaceae bacterium]|nr:sirohydrochlorin cobaltochelatase [Clostridia bacterium]MDD4345484.1 sirohydrochlorin cobaltochelatase [Desulfitobacteriaceae bacterium]MDD4400629.1 sirohydrochlorin cobaltochelatase [Desulfitobacteriaceae bacterium]